MSTPNPPLSSEDDLTLAPHEELRQLQHRLWRYNSHGQLSADLAKVEDELRRRAEEDNAEDPQDV